MQENPVKLPPGIVEESPPDEESRYGRDLGTSAKVTWSWLKSKFGKMPSRDEYTGGAYDGKWGRLYIAVRPFDVNGQWLDNVLQEFTSSGLKDAQRYGFELMRDMPEVQGFWLSAKLEKYWTNEGSFGTKSVMDLGRYEREPLSPKEQALADANARGHQMSQWSGGPMRDRAACVKCGDEMQWIESAWGKGRAEGRAAYDRKCSGDASRYAPNARRSQYQPPATLQLDNGLGAMRLKAERSKTLGGAMLETWKVYPEETPLEPVAQIQIFQNKDRSWSSWSVMPRDRPYGAALAAARNGMTPNHAAVHYGDEQVPNARKLRLTPIEQRALEITEMMSRDKQGYAYVPGDTADSLAKKGLVDIVGIGTYSEKKVTVTEAGLRQLGMYASNHAAVHYVWLVDYRGVPLDTEGPYGPMSLARAEQFARIGATKGEHDRVVSIGDQVMSDGFEILRRYRRGTGERTQ